MYRVFFEIPNPFGSPIPIYAYGTMLFLAFVLGWELMLHVAARMGMNRQRMATLIMYAIIASLAGARLLYAFTNWDKFGPDFPVSLFYFKKLEGLVAFGGYLGGALGVWYWCRENRFDVWAVFDSGAATLALGLGFARVGCLLAGCDFGRPTDSEVALVFPPGSYAYIQHVREGLITKDAVGSLPVVPTQIYEAVYGFLLAGYLYWAAHHFRPFRGAVFIQFYILYSIFRFVIEFYRGDGGRGALAGVSTSQWIALVILPAAGYLWWRFGKDPKFKASPIKLKPRAA